jgi:hypothetical protein
MMNLQEFITETITQIIDGVVQSQKHAKESGAYVNVPVVSVGNKSYKIVDVSLPEPQIIEFDIAVGAIKSEETKGGMGIFVAGIGIGYQEKEDSSGSELSRIKFSIPVVIPSQKETTGDDKINHI